MFDLGRFRTFHCRFSPASVRGATVFSDETSCQRRAARFISFEEMFAYAHQNYDPENF
jgi:hypothetical protein